MEALMFVLALLPIIWLVVALLVFKWPGWAASIGSLAIAALLALLVWQLPSGQVFTAGAEGFLQALWPIVLVIIAAVFTYNLCVRTGAMGKIIQMITSISGDRRILALLLAWCFGGFMEGVAGFGTAVAIPAGMLAGLGFNPVTAVLICLIANGVPTPFGSIGIPTATLSNMIGHDLTRMAWVEMVQLAPFYLITPFIVVFIAAGTAKLAGKKPSLRARFSGVAGITLASGASFVLASCLVAAFVGPGLVVVIGSITALVTTAFLGARAEKRGGLNACYRMKLDAAEVEETGVQKEVLKDAPRLEAASTKKGPLTAAQNLAAAHLNPQAMPAAVVAATASPTAAMAATNPAAANSAPLGATIAAAAGGAAAGLHTSNTAVWAATKGASRARLNSSVAGDEGSRVSHKAANAAVEATTNTTPGAANTADEVTTNTAPGASSPAAVSNPAAATTSLAAATPAPDGAPCTRPAVQPIGLREALKAWACFIILFVLLLGSSRLFPPIQNALAVFSSNVQIYSGPGAATLTFSWINTPGVWILIAAVVGGTIQGATPRVMGEVMLATIKQMARTVVTLLCVLACAKIMSYSGMISTVASFCVAAMGGAYLFIAPLFGALGTFVTGSGTLSCVLFGHVQLEAAAAIGVDPYWVAALNSLGTAAGKMLSPQTMSVGLAAVGIAGKESELFKKVLPVGLVFLVLMSVYAFTGWACGGVFGMMNWVA